MFKINKMFLKNFKPGVHKFSKIVIKSGVYRIHNGVCDLKGSTKSHRKCFPTDMSSRTSSIPFDFIP